MSRIGKLPITLPEKVECTIESSVATVAGPNGALTVPIPSLASVALDDRTLTVSVENTEDPDQRAQWGLARALLANAVRGVTEGFQKSLEIVGVGYKFDVQSPTRLVLSVGYSHKVTMEAPEGVKIAVDEKEKNIIHITGADKQMVGHFASIVRGTRPPEPYKGKGIHYLDEQIRRKAGKTAGKK